MIDKGTLESIALAGLFLAIAILAFFVFAPFFQIMTLAAVFALLLHRPYESLARSLGKNAAAALVVVLVLCFFIAPLLLLGTQIFTEVQSLYGYVHGNEPYYLQMLNQYVNALVQRVSPEFSFNISDYGIAALNFVSGNLAGLVSQTLYVVFQTLLMLLASFFFLRDGRSMLAAAAAHSPFGSAHTAQLLQTVGTTTAAVIRGTLFVALVRWALVAFAFSLFGIPNALLWGSVAGIVGAIPAVGTLFAIVPAVGYLYVEGSGLAALGLAVFGIALIVVVDNLLTADLYGKGFDVSPPFVLFAILGGILYFGPLGFILGPLVLSLFLSILKTSVFLTTKK